MSSPSGTPAARSRWATRGAATCCAPSGSSSGSTARTDVTTGSCTPRKPAGDGRSSALPPEPRDAPSASEELDESLVRMGFDYVDLIYANPPPEGLAIDELVAAVGELV